LPDSTSGIPRVAQLLLLTIKAAGKLDKEKYGHDQKEILSNSYTNSFHAGNFNPYHNPLLCKGFLLLEMTAKQKVAANHACQVRDENEF